MSAWLRGTSRFNKGEEKMTLMVKLTAEEIHREIPYSTVCMGRYGSSWNTMHRKRRWAEEFTESDRAAARRLFAQAHDWTVGRGVPDTVLMSWKTFHLWQKLGDFCASI